MHFAVKRLSQVEVAPRATKARVKSKVARSNQHEFNAGVLRTELGLPKSDTEGELKLLFYLGEGKEQRLEETTFKLYQARKPPRSEYRLYPHTNAIIENARAGDLFAVFRPDPKSTDLVGVVTRRGTAPERDLVAALKLGPNAALKKFVGATEQPAQLSQTTELFPVLASPEESPPHPLVAQATKTGRMPKPREIATAARELVDQRGSLSPDDYFDSAIEEETRLFFAIESAVHRPRVDELKKSSSAGMSEILAFAMSVQQSRKARRGLSLQFHFEELLRKERIPATAQCPTENGERPDFVIPSREAYASKSFPGELLRMVACKSTLRDRWSQPEREAARIAEKYVLSIDEDITSDLFGKMHERKLRLYLPEALRRRRYPKEIHVANVGKLIVDLRTAVLAAQQSGHLATRGPGWA